MKPYTKYMSIHKALHACLVITIILCLQSLSFALSFEDILNDEAMTNKITSCDIKVRSMQKYLADQKKELRSRYDNNQLLEKKYYNLCRGKEYKELHYLRWSCDETDTLCFDEYFTLQKKLALQNEELYDQCNNLSRQWIDSTEDMNSLEELNHDLKEEIKTKEEECRKLRELAAQTGAGNERDSGRQQQPAGLTKDTVQEMIDVLSRELSESRQKIRDACKELGQQDKTVLEIKERFAMLSPSSIALQKDIENASRDCADAPSIRAEIERLAGSYSQDRAWLDSASWDADTRPEQCRTRSDAESLEALLDNMRQVITRMSSASGTARELNKRLKEIINQAAYVKTRLNSSNSIEPNTIKANLADMIKDLEYHRNFNFYPAFYDVKLSRTDSIELHEGASDRIRSALEPVGLVNDPRVSSFIASVNAQKPLQNKPCNEDSSRQTIEPLIKALKNSEKDVAPAMDKLRNRPLCEGITGADDLIAQSGMTEYLPDFTVIAGMIRECRSRIGQQPPQEYTNPARNRNTLVGFRVACEPAKPAQGDVVNCTATGAYLENPTAAVDLTRHELTDWDPAWLKRMNYRIDVPKDAKPGTRYSITASHRDQSGNVWVTVAESKQPQVKPPKSESKVSWVRQPAKSNQTGGFKASESSIVYNDGKNSNTLTWGGIPDTVVPGQKVSLSMNVTSNPGAWMETGWGFGGSFLKDMTPGNKGLTSDARHVGLQQNSFSFTWSPDASDEVSISVSGGNAHCNCSGNVTWVYKKQTK